MDIPYWVNFLLWGLIILVAFVVLFLFNIWALNREVTDKKTKKTKMLGEIWGADGFPKRHLVAIEPNGKTVRINGGTYRLSGARGKGERENGGEEKSGREGEEEISSPPVLRFDKYPKKPFLGIGPQKTLRLESWQEGNPEPIKPFYGKFVNAEGDACDPAEEGAKFVQNRLAVTATEITGLINEAHLAAASIETEELKAREQSFREMMGNLPNKMVLYLGLGLCVIMSGVGVVIIWGLKSAMGY